MRYVLAIVLPPFALLGCGRPFQFVLNTLFLGHEPGLPRLRRRAGVVTDYMMSDGNQKMAY